MKKRNVSRLLTVYDATDIKKATILINNKCVIKYALGMPPIAL